jgi:hypothetical protein
MLKKSYALMASLMAIDAMDVLKSDIILKSMPQPFDPKRAVKSRKTGIKYPHSSTRQQARYARQIAAGKLQMDGV